MKKWTVEVEGVKHIIEYKKGLRCKIIVDGEAYKVKSSNWLINLIDYEISFGDTKCNLVAIGNKVDLSVNGTFLDSKNPYEPVDKMPSWVLVLVGISTLGGMLIGGVLSLIIGLLMSTLYVQFALKKKTGAVIGCFSACCIIQLILTFVIASLLN